MAGDNLSRRALKTFTAAPRCSLEPAPVNSIYRFSLTFGPFLSDTAVLSLNFSFPSAPVTISIGTYPFASIQIPKIPIPSISKNVEYTRLDPAKVLILFSMARNLGLYFSRLCSGGPSIIKCVAPISRNFSFAALTDLLYNSAASFFPSIVAPPSPVSSSDMDAASSSRPATFPSISPSIITSRSFPVSTSCSSRFLGLGLVIASGKTKLHA